MARRPEMGRNGTRFCLRYSNRCRVFTSKRIGKKANLWQLTVATSIGRLTQSAHGKIRKQSVTHVR